MRRYYYYLLFIGLFVPFVPIKAENSFVQGIFKYIIEDKVYDKGNGEHAVLGDTTVRITTVNQAELTIPMFSDSVLVIPGHVVHNGYKYQVSTVDQRAFARCHSLETLIISEGVECIFADAFYGCTNLQSVHFPSTLQVMEDNAFRYCPNLREINVDGKNKRYYSLRGCNVLIDRYYGGQLVMGCYTSFIPKGVKNIGRGAFEGSLRLEHITVPEGVDEMEGMVFMGCANLKSVSLPNSLKIIGCSTFAGCTSLKSVRIPENVSQIGNKLGCAQFAGCLRLDTIIVDKKNKVYDSREGCNAIVETACDKIVSGCRTTRIVDGIKEIGDFAFSNVMLSGIAIPKTVTKIGDRAFAGCVTCVLITVDEDNPVYDSRGGCNAVIETATNKIVLGCINTSFPETVKEIGKHCFCGMKLPQTLQIPGTISKIGWGAFSASSGLERVFIPTSVKEMDSFVFDSCENLREVYWNGFVEEIPPYAFSGCVRLFFFEVPEGTKVIHDSAFQGCERLSCIALPSTLELIEIRAFDGVPCEELVKKNHASVLASNYGKSQGCTHHCITWEVEE